MSPFVSTSSKHHTNELDLAAILGVFLPFMRAFEEFEQTIYNSRELPVPPRNLSRLLVMILGRVGG